tara:strand:- start:6688 stop:6858 length:171 start_codon:yes stop_codon:yes gene_type:complete
LTSKQEEKPLINIRAEPILPNELLYDNNGLAVAIKINGEILPIVLVNDGYSSDKLY